MRQTLVIEIEPGQAVRGVRLRVNRRRRRRFARQRSVLVAVDEVNVHTAAIVGVPSLHTVRVGVKLLPDLSSGPKPHRRCAQYRGRSWRFFRRSIGEPSWTRLEDEYLDPADGLGMSHLGFERVPHSQRHRHKLVDAAVSGNHSVQPRLGRAHQIVLRISSQTIVPGGASHRVDTADTNLDRIRLPRRRVKPDPECLSLIERNKDPVVVVPRAWQALGEIRDALDREPAETGWQRIGPAVIGDAQCAVERYGEVLTDPYSVSLDGHVQHGCATAKLAMLRSTRSRKSVRRDVSLEPPSSSRAWFR